jgi:hypothetical protein
MINMSNAPSSRRISGMVNAVIADCMPCWAVQNPIGQQSEV